MNIIREIYYRFVAEHSIKGVRQGVLERRNVFPVSDILKIRTEAFEKGEKYAIIDNVVVKLTSQTLMTFAEKGCTCIRCGIEGTYFALERHASAQGKSAAWLLNLYGINKRGEEVFMNKDHIIPRSKGGENSIENYNPMCVTCNNKKSNRVEGKSRGWKLSKVKPKVK